MRLEAPLYSAATRSGRISLIPPSFLPRPQLLLLLLLLLLAIVDVVVFWILLVVVESVPQSLTSKNF